MLEEGLPVGDGQLVGLPSNTSGAGRDTDAEVVELVGQVGGHPHLVADTLGERSAALTRATKASHVTPASSGWSGP